MAVEDRQRSALAHECTYTHPNDTKTTVTDDRIPPLGEVQAGPGLYRGCGRVGEHEEPWSLQAVQAL